MSCIKTLKTTSVVDTDKGVDLVFAAPTTLLNSGVVVNMLICQNFPTDLDPLEGLDLLIGDQRFDFLDNKGHTIFVSQLKTRCAYRVILNTEWFVAIVENCLPKVTRDFPTIPVIA